jgi:prepilin-type N-terminal cleavage/methylation domain-containing protein
MDRLRLAAYNKNGMTLIEVMMAMSILAIVALAVMQTAIVGMRTNVKNSLRDFAVNVADQRMNELRDTAFDAIPLGGPAIESAVTGTFRGGFTIKYTPRRTVTFINTDTKQIDLSVSWPFSKQTYTHTVSTIVRRQ